MGHDISFPWTDSGRDENCEWAGVTCRSEMAGYYRTQRKNPGFTPITQEVTCVYYNCSKLYVWVIIKWKHQLEWLAG
jgi:hypothetical protein